MQHAALSHSAISYLLQHSTVSHRHIVLFHHVHSHPTSCLLDAAGITSLVLKQFAWPCRCTAQQSKAGARAMMHKQVQKLELRACHRENCRRLRPVARVVMALMQVTT